LPEELSQQGNVQLRNGRFTAQVQASSVQLGRLASVPPSLQGGVSGNFNLSGSLTSFSPSTIQGSGSGRLNIGGGTLTARNVQLSNGNFTAQVQASGVQLGRLASVPPSLQGGVSGNFNLSGSLTSFSLARFKVVVQDDYKLTEARLPRTISNCVMVILRLQSRHLISRWSVLLRCLPRYEVV
jgi:hypothetical protein